MDFDQLIKGVAGLRLNLYDFALYTPSGIQTHHFQPCSNCSNSYSVAKVFIVTALGMLWDEGKIQMDDLLSKYFEFPAHADPKWHQATIEHAVTHQLGFDEGFLDIDTEDVTAYPTEDYLSIVLRRPLAHAPGTHQQYSDAAYYLLSRLIGQVTGEAADVFINRRLLRPLRFHEAAWSRCPFDHPIGATGLYISAGDMVKLGALYLEDGVWAGNRLLSHDWIQLAMDREYELHPQKEEARTGLIGKWGMCGQFLGFSPADHLAIAWHAHMNRESSDKLLDYIHDVLQKETIAP